MVIYADLIFFINSVSNYIMLLLLGAVTKKRASVLRLLLASCAGAAAATLIFCAGTSSLFAALIRVGIALAMALLSYGKNKLLRTTAIFIPLIYSFSGMVFMIISMTDKNVLSVIKNGVIYFGIEDKSFLFVLISGYASAFVFVTALKIMRAKVTVPISITLEDKTITTNALYDSGNLLKDPSSGKGVIIADWEAVKELFGYSYDELYSHIGELSIRLIPYHSVGNTEGVLPVFTAGMIKTQDCIFENAPVGISEHILSKRGDYHALIGNI